jgi:hypothetical protein
MPCGGFCYGRKSEEKLELVLIIMIRKEWGKTWYMFLFRHIKLSTYGYVKVETKNMGTAIVTVNLWI